MNFDLPRRDQEAQLASADTDPLRSTITVPPNDSLLVAIDKGGTTPPPIDASGGTLKVLPPEDTTLVDLAGPAIQGKALKTPPVSSQDKPQEPAEPLTPQKTPVSVAKLPVSPNNQGMPAADGSKNEPSDEEHIEAAKKVKKKKVRKSKSKIKLGAEGEMEIPGLEALNMRLCTAVGVSGEVKGLMKAKRSTYLPVKSKKVLKTSNICVRFFIKAKHKGSTTIKYAILCNRKRFELTDASDCVLFLGSSNVVGRRNLGNNISLKIEITDSSNGNKRLINIPLPTIETYKPGGM